MKGSFLRMRTRSVEYDDVATACPFPYRICAKVKVHLPVVDCRRVYGRRDDINMGRHSTWSMRLLASA
jgi:hypothetical protein